MPGTPHRLVPQWTRGRGRGSLPHRGASPSGGSLIVGLKTAPDWPPDQACVDDRCAMEEDWEPITSEDAGETLHGGHGIVSCTLVNFIITVNFIDL